jgi:pyridoxal phosphate enzyme (YggS family)
MRRKLSENLKRVRERIERACGRARRDPAEVMLVAVTKSVGVDVIRTLLELGVLDLGESRVQALTQRAAIIQESFSRRPLDPDGGASPQPRWHMVGHLQRNKVRAVLPWISMVHSVDSLRLAEDLDAESARLSRRLPMFLEVNASGEASKEGVAVAAALHLAEQLATLNHIEVRGLMAMAPLTDNAEVIRRTFARVREVFEEIVSERVAGPQFRELSMLVPSDSPAISARGTTTLILGCMFSGKTTELLRRLVGPSVVTALAIKHATDTRFAPRALVSHSGKAHSATVVAQADEIPRLISNGINLLAIDEAHFFDDRLIGVIEQTARLGIDVVVASLEPDSWGRTFPINRGLREIADECLLLRATCAHCGRPADRTQRLTPIVNGQMVVDPSHYEPRCTACWQPPCQAAAAL